MIDHFKLSHNIRLSFFVAGGILILLALINISVAERKVQDQILDLQLISLSGKQRLYSQKIAKDALLIQTAADSMALQEGIVQIQKDVHEWNGFYDALADRSNETQYLSLLEPEQSSTEILELTNAAQTRRLAMVNTVSILITAARSVKPNAPTEIRETVSAILKLEPLVLQDYGNISTQYMKEANARLSGLEKWLWQTTLISMTVVLVLGFFLLRPLKKIVKNFLLYQKAQIKRLRISSEELARTNAFQKAMLESAIVSIVATDENGIITHVNNTAAHWLGYAPVELIGNATPAIFHSVTELELRATELSSTLGQEINPDFEVFIAPLQNAPFDTNEWMYVRRDGSRFPILLTISPIWSEAGDIIGYLGVGCDMTQKREVEEKLRESEHFYRILSHNAKDLVCLHDMDSCYTYISDAVTALLGYEPKELIGTHPMELMHPDDIAHVEEMRLQAVADGEGPLLQYRLKRKDDEYVWVETQVTLLRDDAGNITHLQSSTRDINARKKFQEQLERSEYNLQEAQRVARLGSWEVDLLSEKTLWSLEMYRLHGLEPHSELPELNKFVHLLYPDDRRQFLIHMHNAREHGKEHDWDLRIVLPNGSLRWLYTIIRVYKNAKGEVIKLYGTAMDITESRRAREELTESNRLVNALFDHSPLPIQIFDKNGFSLRMNEARRKLLGLPSVAYRVGQYNVLTDVVSQSTGLDIYYQRAYDAETVMLRDQFMDLSDKTDSEQSDLRRVYYDHLIFPLQNSEGCVEAVVSFVQDITERIDAAQQARQARRFMESVANATPDSLFVMDTEQQSLIYANCTLQAFLGFSGREIKDTEKILMSQSVLPSDLPLLNTYLEGFPSEGTHSIEFHVRNAQGHYRLICLHAVAFQFGKDGRVTQIVGSAQDITDNRESELRLWHAYRELKASEEELRSNGEELMAMNEAMEETIEELRSTQAQLIQSEKMASLGQLTAGIAHEINNPINFVYAGVDNLKQSLSELYQILVHYERIEELDSAEHITMQLAAMKEIKQSLFYLENKEGIWLTLQSIEQGAARTTEIVKGLRMFSRLDEAESKFANINEGLDSTLILLTAQIKNRIQIIREYDIALPEIECYPGQLNQVFMNLLTNAIQAIEGSGQIYIRTISEEDTIVIAITDSGAGMSEDVQKKIFDPFFTTKPVGQGTGLGLSISYSIIQKHQGVFEVNTQPGQGTTFTIRLPKVIQTQEVVKLM